MPAAQDARPVQKRRLPGRKVPKGEGHLNFHMILGGAGHCHVDIANLAPRARSQQARYHPLAISSTAVTDISR